MDFYTDGSRIGLNSDKTFIGWSAICGSGIVSSGSQIGGSNINAEMFAIRDLLNKLTSHKKKLIENENTINIITDSLTSIQIINGYTKEPQSYDLSSSDNYVAADSIVKSIDKLSKSNKEVIFTHIRGHRDNLGNNFADYVATQKSQELMEKTNV